ncbi:MAG: hypothetical protein QM528_03520 [Phycisphaerales bacterium]|nr:hypothetical protein [Phycisphaerales bacterium]
MKEVQSDQFALQNIAFFGRSAEYLCELFDIKDIKSLEGKKVLDCPGGPSGLNKYFKDHQIHCVSVDPLYKLDSEAAAKLGERDVDNCLQLINSDNKAKLETKFTNFADVSHNVRKIFIADYELGKAEGRYVVDQLPQLSFKDQSFDVVLSSHLLFLYAPKSVGGITADEHTPLNYQWHLDSVFELMRVAKQEVRIARCSRFDTYFYEHRLELHPWAKRIIDELHAKKIKTELIETPLHGPIISATYMLRIVL